MSLAIHRNPSPVQQAKNLKLTLQAQRDYGASGSSETTTGSITSGTKSFAVSAAKDFATGQHVVIDHAGTAPTNTLPDPTTKPFLTILGTNSGSTMPAGTAYVAVSYIGPTGETKISPIAAITTAAGDLVGIQTALPFGALGIGVYAGTSADALYQAGTLDLNGSGSGSYPTLYLNGYLNSGNGYDPTRCGNGQPLQGVLGEIPASTQPSPPTSNTATVAPSASASVNGNTGSTSYTYWVCPLTWRGGVFVPGTASATVTNGPSGLSSGDSITVTWGLQNAPAYAVYGDSSNPSGSQGLLGVTVVPKLTDTGAGAIANIPPYLPSTLPSGSPGDALRTSIADGGGTTSLTLKDAAGSTVTAATIRHHDAPAIQSAINDLLAAGGGELLLEPGQYNLAETVWLDNQTATTGFVELDIRIRGSGNRNTVVQAVPGTHGPMFASDLTGMAYGYGVSYFQCADLTFDGQCWYDYNKSPTNYTTFASAFYLLLSTSWITGCQFQNLYDGAWLTGLREGEAGGVMIQHCNWFDCYHVAVTLDNDSNVGVVVLGSNGGNNFSTGALAYPQNDEADGALILVGSDIVVANGEAYGGSCNVRIFGNENLVECLALAGPVKNSVVWHYGASQNILEGNKFQLCLSSDAATTYDAIHSLGGCIGNFVGGNSWTDTGSGTPWRYLLNEGSGDDHNTVTANQVHASAITSGVSIKGAQSVVTNNPGYNPRGWATTTPGLPAGTGSSDAVTNSNPYPVRVIQDGASGTTIVDPSGTTKALATDPVELTLDPAAKIYYATTVPSAWNWYGA